MRIFRFIWLLISLPSIAQVSGEGRFSADFAAGCAPLTINLTELIPIGTVRQYSYEDPEEFTTDLTYTYTTPGSYDIVQVHNDDAFDPKTDTLRIQIFESTTSNFNYYLCDNREVLVEIDDPTYDQYEIIFASTSNSTVPDQGTATYSYGMSDPLSIEIRGIFSGAKDNCSSSTFFLPEVINNLTSPTIQTASISQTCENQFDLRLSTATEEKVIYQVEVDQGSGYQILYEGKFENESVLQLANFNESNNQVDVRINSYNICDATYVIGNPFSLAIEAGQLEPIQNLHTTYEGNNILISLNSIETGAFKIERSFDQASYSNLTTSTTSHTDDTGFLGRQYFYKVSYLDTCDGIWNTKKSAPPFIRATELEPSKYQVEFDKAVFPFNESVTYTGIISGNGEEIELPINTMSFELNVPPNLGTKQTFFVRGTSDSFEFSSNTLTLKYEFVIHVPKAFTPNGDGLNDRLEFFGIDDSQAELKIYTRWGQQVYFEISSAPAWDGRINGNIATDGIYIYEISVPQISNQVQKGTFALLKR